MKIPKVRLRELQEMERKIQSKIEGVARKGKTQGKIGGSERHENTQGKIEEVPGNGEKKRGEMDGNTEKLVVVCIYN